MLAEPFAPTLGRKLAMPTSGRFSKETFGSMTSEFWREKSIWCQGGLPANLFQSEENTGDLKTIGICFQKRHGLFG